MTRGWGAVQVLAGVAAPTSAVAVFCALLCCPDARTRRIAFDELSGSIARRVAVEATEGEAAGEGGSGGGMCGGGGGGGDTSAGAALAGPIADLAALLSAHEGLPEAEHDDRLLAGSLLATLLCLRALRAAADSVKPAAFLTVARVLTPAALRGCFMRADAAAAFADDACGGCGGADERLFDASLSAAVDAMVGAVLLEAARAAPALVADWWSSCGRAVSLSVARYVSEVRGRNGLMLGS